MALQGSGAITLAQVQTEFGGVNPISMTEYYRDGAYVTTNNTSVPTSGTVSMSNFYGGARAYSIEYQIIGAGGAGGYGLNNGSGSGTNSPGGASTLTSLSITNVSAAGGTGGTNANLGSPFTGGNGVATTYGSGGIGGAGRASEPVNPGGSAPATSYGAGGGGAGGDDASTYDSSGAAGGGGQAGTYLTGTFANLVPGAQIAVSIGSGGVGTGGNASGGNGANGYARLRVSGGEWTAFTTSGTYTVPN